MASDHAPVKGETTGEPVAHQDRHETELRGYHLKSEKAKESFALISAESLSRPVCMPTCKLLLQS